MTKEKRQLAAIMFTDMVGYTAYMSKDRQLALQLLEKNRQLHRPIIKKHNGRLIKEIGDGILASFPTASEAVFCASELQLALSGDPQLSIRIAIHLGEIVFTEGDVFGDGVNIASRIESITPPRAIFISDAVYREIRNINEIETCYQGENNFKNADLPTKIYAICAEHIYTPKDKLLDQQGRQNSTHLKPKTWMFATLVFIAAIILFLIMNEKDVPRTKPVELEKTIAVLPFENLSDDPETSYFSLGVTEDILIQLSKIGALKVIDRSNLRKYDHLDKSFHQIGEELNVKNLLWGRVRKKESQVRVSARLIDVKTGQQIWAETYDRNITDIFSIQTEIAVSISEALRARITEQESQQLIMDPTSNITAYDLFLQGKEYYSRYTLEDNFSAIELFKQALNMDARFTPAHAGLSDAFAQLAQKSHQRNIWLDSSRYHANQVLKFDPVHSGGYKSLGLYYSISGDTEKAIEQYQKAVEIDNNIEALINLSRLYYRTGQLKKSLKLLKSAQWHNPMEEDLWFNLGATYYRMNNFSSARNSLERALLINPNHVNSLLLKWFIAVLEDDHQTIFRIGTKLGRIGQDNSDDMLLNIQQAIAGEQPDAFELSRIMSGRDLDFIDFDYLFNLLGYIYLKGGMSSKADSLFEFKRQHNLQKISQGDLSYKNLYELAQIFVIKMDHEKALDYLSRAEKAGWTEFVYAQKDPFFKELRTEDGFQKIIEQATGKLDALNQKE